MPRIVMESHSEQVQIFSIAQEIQKKLFTAEILLNKKVCSKSEKMNDVDEEKVTEGMEVESQKVNHVSNMYNRVINLGVFALVVVMQGMYSYGKKYWKVANQVSKITDDIVQAMSSNIRNMLVQVQYAVGQVHGVTKPDNKEIKKQKIKKGKPKPKSHSTKGSRSKTSTYSQFGTIVLIVIGVIA